MKKYLASALLLVITLSAYAQRTDPTKLKLADGRSIRPDQLDSLNKAWGGNGYRMIHDDQQPGVTIIAPITAEMLKKQADQKASLDALLNTPAPDFTLTDLSGKKWILRSLKGKTVVLNFWFTTCPPCIHEMPELNELVKTYKKEKVVFLALGRNSAAQIKSFRKTHPFNYTHLPDTDKVGDLYQINSYPTSLVIDPKGVIRYIQVGGKDIKQQIVAAINKIKDQ